MLDVCPRFPSARRIVMLACTILLLLGPAGCGEPADPSSRETAGDSDAPNSTSDSAKGVPEESWTPPETLMPRNGRSL